MERQAINSAIINYLSPYRPERIGVFGSFARHEEKIDSDIDILVKFKETISLLELVRIHRELSALLGKRVDLITEQALKNERIKKYIYDDLQIIFERRMIFFISKTSYKALIEFSPIFQVRIMKPLSVISLLKMQW